MQTSRSVRSGAERMAVGRYHESVGRSDLARWSRSRVDQVGETFRKVRVLMIGCTHDFVRRTDDPVSVGEQRIVKRLRVFERRVVRRSIERCSEDVAVGIGKVSGSVTLGLSLTRSTRGGGLRVPPQEHPVSSLIGERHEMAILVG